MPTDDLIRESIIRGENSWRDKETGEYVMDENNIYIKESPNSSAVGAYQFQWSTWGDEVVDYARDAGYRGVRTKDDFISSPELQDDFFDYYVENYARPEIENIKNTTNTRLSDEQLYALYHKVGGPMLKRAIENETFDAPIHDISLNEYLRRAGLEEVQSPQEQRQQREEQRQQQLEEREEQKYRDFAKEMSPPLESDNTFVAPQIIPPQDTMPGVMPIMPQEIFVQNPQAQAQPRQFTPQPILINEALRQAIATPIFQDGGETPSRSDRRRDRSTSTPPVSTSTPPVSISAPSAIPTRQDSLDLLQNANLVRAYYEDTGNYESTGQYRNSDGSLVFDELEQLRQRFDGTGEFLGPDGFTEDHLHHYYRPLDDNRFYQRERAAGVLDTRAPMSLFDTRISPQFVINYSNENKNDFLHGDAIGLYQYDPLAVTPWDMLTPEQQKQRLELYGTAGTPYTKRPQEELLPPLPTRSAFEQKSIQPQTNLQPVPQVEIPLLNREFLFTTGFNSSPQGIREFRANPDSPAWRRAIVKDKNTGETTDSFPLFKNGGEAKDSDYDDTLIYPVGDSPYRFQPINLDILIRNKNLNNKLRREYQRRTNPGLMLPPPAGEPGHKNVLISTGYLQRAQDGGQIKIPLDKTIK